MKIVPSFLTEKVLLRRTSKKVLLEKCSNDKYEERDLGQPLHLKLFYYNIFHKRSKYLGSQVYKYSEAFFILTLVL